jgi:hypothetical protein
MGNKNKSAWQNFYDNLQTPHLILIGVLVLFVCFIGAIVIGKPKVAIDQDQTKVIYSVVSEYEKIKDFGRKLKTDNSNKTTKEYLSLIINFKTDTAYKFWSRDNADPKLKEVLESLDRAEKDMKELKIIAERVNQNIDRNQVISDEDIENQGKLLSDMFESTDKAYNITRSNN